MATFNKEDLIKWNDLSTSLQDIIMRKITWNMLHPDLQAWLLDKEKRIIELERWRRTKADPMLDDHERRIGSCESQISSLWSKLGDVEDDIEDFSKPPSPGDPTQDWAGGCGWVKLPGGLIIQWGSHYVASHGKVYQIQKYPIPFPHKPFAISGVDAGAYNGNPVWMSFNIFNTNTGYSGSWVPVFDPRKEFAYLGIHASGGYGGVGFTYMAIGY